MDRLSLSLRVQEIIHEVTGVWVEEDQYLDFERDHRGKMESIALRLRDEFLCVDEEDIPEWDTVDDILDLIERRMRDDEG